MANIFLDDLTYLDETNILYDWNKARYFSQESMRDLFKELEDAIYKTNKAPNTEFKKKAEEVLQVFNKQLNTAKTAEALETFIKDASYATKSLLKWSEDPAALERITKANIGLVIGALGLSLVNPLFGAIAAGAAPVTLIAAGADSTIKPMYIKVVSSDVKKLYQEIEKLKTQATKKFAILNKNK